MFASTDLVHSLNQTIELDEGLEALEARLSVELLEERLEMDCWVYCQQECLVTFLS